METVNVIIMAQPLEQKGTRQLRESLRTLSGDREASTRI